HYDTSTVNLWTNVALPQNSFRDPSLARIDPGIDHFSLYAARYKTHKTHSFVDCDGGDDHLRLNGYANSCIGIDARSIEKPYWTMRAAPDGFHRLDEARVSSRLPQLPKQKGSHSGCAERNNFIEHQREFWLLD